MNLKTFDPTTNPNFRKGTDIPAVSIYLKAGTFNINKAAAELMDLQNENQVVIHQDEENVENWFVEKVSENGYTVKLSEPDKYPLFFSNVVICRAMADSVDFELDVPIKSCRVELMPEPKLLNGRKLFHIEMTSAVPKY